MEKDNITTCRTKKAESQMAGSKALAPLGDPAGSDIPAAPPGLHATDRGHWGFPDGVYLLASVIFQNTRLEKPAAHQLVNYGEERGVPLPEVKDQEMQRAAYELAFNTLKYQELLEYIVINSGLYHAQPKPHPQMGLAAVMLYDFQDRKFLSRKQWGEAEVIQEVRDVENYLLRFKTKLAASLACYRVKHDLLSIECMLPVSVKTKQERSRGLPLYTWVNTLKISLDEVHSALRSAGFAQVQSIGQLEGQTFSQDPHCRDVLVFPAQLRAQLRSTELLRDHKLIIQDKSCSLGPNAACSILPEEGDVLMVGCFSSLTVSHTASLIAEKYKGDSNSQPTVYVCVGDRTDAQSEDLQRAVSTMGCKNVKLIPVVFQSLDSRDKRLQKVRVILLIPWCSVSAVSNPVEFILQENGDVNLLQDLSQGSVAPGKLEALVAQQRKDIDHALKFPKAVAVVYATCSSYPEENEKVVSRALEQAEARSGQKREPSQAHFRLSPSPFSSPDTAKGLEETGPFFTLEPSDQSNGCFLAVLTREPEPVVKESPQEVLARANAKGLLDKINCNQPSRKEHRGHPSRMTTGAHACLSGYHLSVSIQPRNRETKGSNGATLCGHQDFAKTRQSSQALHQDTIRSKQDSSSPSKPKDSPPSKSITPAFNTTTAASATTAPPLPPVAAHPRRAPQMQPKPTVLVLPPVHFPAFFPSVHSRMGHSTRFTNNRWRTLAQRAPSSRASAGLTKDSKVKSRPLF